MLAVLLRSAVTNCWCLTYDDVTNVDSLGIVTAGGGLEMVHQVLAETITATGAVEFAGILMQHFLRKHWIILGDVDIADKIIHTGDTNTAIRFPAADTLQ